MFNERIYNFSAGPSVLPEAELKKAQEQMRELQTAKANVDRILNMEISESEKEKEAEQR